MPLTKETKLTSLICVDHILIGCMVKCTVGSPLKLSPSLSHPPPETICEQHLYHNFKGFSIASCFLLQGGEVGTEAFNVPHSQL